jgi:hypothetical protein
MRRSSTALAVLVVCALVLLVAGCGGDVESRLPTTTVQTETDGEGGENENEPGETEREGDESEDEGGSEWGDPISQADSRGFTLPDKRRVGTSAASLGKASLQRAAGWAPPRITPTEHGDVRCSSRRGDPHQDPSHIVHVAAFEQAAIGVDLVDEEVAARRDPGDAKILAFEGSHRNRRRSRRKCLPEAARPGACPDRIGCGRPSRETSPATSSRRRSGRRDRNRSCGPGQHAQGRSPVEARSA